MSTLTIRKKSLKTWLHIDSGLGSFIISKFYFNADNLFFQIVEQGNSKRLRYNISDITLFDDVNGGGAETFTTITELSLRLEALNYPAFFRDGESPLPSLNDLTNVNVSGVTDGQILAYDVATNKWVNVNASSLGDVALVDLTDVTIATPTNGQVLTYNSVSGKWENQVVNVPSLQQVGNVGSVFTKTVGDFTYTFELYESGSFASIIQNTTTGIGSIIGHNEQQITIQSNSTARLSNINFDNDVQDGLWLETYGGTSAIAINRLVIPFQDVGFFGQCLFYLPNNKTGGIYTIALQALVQTSDFTAQNNTPYSTNGTITVTDPTPENNKGYIVHVIGGTTTIGGVAYTVGALVYRFYNGTAWISTNMAGGGASWGSITGTLSSQTDLNNALNSRVIKSIADNVTSSAVTGTNLETLVKTYSIAGGLFTTDDAFKLLINIEKTGVAGTSVIRFYVNETNNFATARLLATSQTANANIRDHFLSRQRAVFKGNNIKTVAQATSFIQDISAGNNAIRSLIALNPANAFFGFVSIQNTAVADSVVVDSVNLTN